MDIFSFAVSGIYEVGKILGLWFFSRFLHGKARFRHYLGYLLISGALYVLEVYFRSSFVVSLMLEIGILCLIGITLYDSAFSASVSAAVLTVSILVLSNGVMNPVMHFLGPVVIRINSGLLPVMSMVVSFLSILLTWLSYRVILRKFHTISNRYLAVFFIPILLLLLMERYISEHIYGSVIIVGKTGVVCPTVDNFQIFVLESCAYLCFFVVLYACQKLSEDYSNQMRLVLLEREISCQKEYLREAKARHRQTQAFRHDIQGHLIALDGLLKSGEFGKAKNYLSRLEDVSESLSLTCQTGNTVVDALLNSKLSMPRQNDIQIECFVEIPSPCSIDDMDLCVIFSNALDNAVKASMRVHGKERYIRISGKRRGDFFMLEFENKYSPENVADGGTGIGLSNIETIARKYRGAVTVEKANPVFRLNVLLVIPRHVTDNSGKSA